MSNVRVIVDGVLQDKTSRHYSLSPRLILIQAGTQLHFNVVINYFKRLNYVVKVLGTEINTPIN
jgi:hypothetical protein